MNYASKRWNPSIDPSSFIFGALTGHHRLKIASGNHCRIEVLSFDGNILRFVEAILLLLVCGGLVVNFFFFLVFLLTHFLFCNDIYRSNALSLVYEVATRPIDDTKGISTMKVDPEETDNRKIILLGVNLIFDGSEMHPFDIGACL